MWWLDQEEITGHHKLYKSLCSWIRKEPRYYKNQSSNTLPGEYLLPLFCPKSCTYLHKWEKSYSTELQLLMILEYHVLLTFLSIYNIVRILGKALRKLFLLRSMSSQIILCYYFSQSNAFVHTLQMPYFNIRPLQKPAGLYLRPSGTLEHGRQQWMFYF